MSTTTKPKPSAATKAAPPKSTLLVLESLDNDRGEEAPADLVRVIDQLDHLIRRDDPAYFHHTALLTDPVRLLRDRHGATVRLEWLRARAAGEESPAFSRDEPTASQLMAHAKAALRFRAVSRFSEAARGMTNILGDRLKATNTEIVSRIGAYCSAFNLATSWEENEATLDSLGELRAELSKAVDRLSPISEAILSRFRESAAACVGELEAEVVARGIVEAKDLTDKTPFDNLATEQAKEEYWQTTNGLGGMAAQTRDAIEQAAKSELDRKLAENAELVKQDREVRTAWTVRRHAGDVLLAAEDPSAWQGIGELMDAHPDKFPPGIADRWLGPVHDSISAVSADDLIEVSRYL